MNKRFIYIFVFAFVMFFCVGNVRAYNEKGTGGSGGTSYSYGIVCTYGGERSITTYGRSDQNDDRMSSGFPYTYTLRVNCSNASCGKLNISVYGLIKDQDDAQKEITIDNMSNLGTMVNYNSNKFGFREGSGVSNCPSNIGFEYKKLNASQSDKIHEFGNLLLGAEANRQGSLESKEQFSADNAGKIDIKKVTSDSVSGKKRTTTHTTGQGENAHSTVIENKNQHGSNADFVGYVMDAVKNLGNEDYGVSADGTVTCQALLGKENMELMHNFFLFICIFGVLLVIVFGMSDFIKALTSGDDDALAQSFKKIKTRIISVIILLLLPVFIDFILGLANDNLHYVIVDGEGNNSGKDVSLKVGRASDCE